MTETATGPYGPKAKLRPPPLPQRGASSSGARNSGDAPLPSGPTPPSGPPLVFEDLEALVHRLEQRVQDLEGPNAGLEVRLRGLENVIIRWQHLQDLLNGLTGLFATFAPNFSI